MNEEDNLKNWFNVELIRLKTEKVIKYQIAKMENTEVAYANYKIVRNIYKTKSDFEKTNFVNKKISNAKTRNKCGKR